MAGATGKQFEINCTDDLIQCLWSSNSTVIILPCLYMRTLSKQYWLVLLQGWSAYKKTSYNIGCYKNWLLQIQDFKLQYWLLQKTSCVWFVCGLALHVLTLVSSTSQASFVWHNAHTQGQAIKPNQFVKRYSHGLDL